VAGLTQRDHIPGNLLDELDGLRQRVAAVERTATTPTVIIGDAAALIATHASDAGAHHSPVTIGAGGLSAKLGISAQTLTLADIAHAELTAIDANQHIDHTSVSVLAGNGLTGGGTIAASRTLHLDTPGTLTASTTNSATGNHTHAITSAYDVTDPSPYSAILRSNNAGGITLAEMATMRVTSHLIPKLTDTYDLGTSTLLWRKGWLSELDTVLFAENTVTLLGGWFYVTKYAGTAQEDVNDSQTQIDLGVDDAALSAGDHVVFRQSLQMEYMTLGAYAGSNVWNVTRDVDGSGANAWPEGAPFVVLGQSGDGRIELNAYDTPRISIIKQGVAYNAQTELIRLGDLNGMADYTGEEYGVFIGDYADGRWMAYDETHSLRIRGDALIEGTVDATKFSVGMRDQLFSRAGGLLLLNSDAPMTPTSWTSLRGQVATISGAFHPVAGPWAGSRALMLEMAATNLDTNPVFRNWSGGLPVGWTAVNSPTVSQESSVVLHDLYSTRITYASANADRGIYKDISGLTPAATVTVTVYAKTSSGGQARMVVFDGGGFSNPVTTTSPVNTDWARLEVQKTVPAGGSIRVVLVNRNTSGVSYFDAVQVEATGYRTTFIYGDMGSGYAWTGTAHASTSTRSASRASFDTRGRISPAQGSMVINFQLGWDTSQTGLPTTRGLFRWWDSFNTESLYIVLSATSITVESYAGSSSQSLSAYSLDPGSAGDWHELALTWSASANELKLYVDGALVRAGTWTAPSIASTTAYLGYVTAYGAGPISQFATMGTVLTPEQVAALYHRNAPLADAGAFDTPGIYILDGRFRVASSTGDTRIEITPEEIAGYGGGGKQFWLQASDGKAYAGAGNVWLDANGISIEALGSDISDIKWYIDAVQVSRIRAYQVEDNNFGFFDTFATSSGKVAVTYIRAVGYDSSAYNAHVMISSGTAEHGPYITNRIGNVAVFDVVNSEAVVKSGSVLHLESYGLYASPPPAPPAGHVLLWVGTDAVGTYLNIQWSDGVTQQIAFRAGA